MTTTTACLSSRALGRRPVRGVATIFVTVVLLLAAGLIALYTNRSAVMEQRLAANDVRAKQALAAASAGIDHALAYMRAGGIDHPVSPTQGPDGVVDTITANVLTSSGGVVSTYRVAYVDSTSAFPACPSTVGGAWPGFTAPTVMTLVAAVSCGWSDDNTSVQRVVQTVSSTPSTGGSISTPLITRSTADLLTGGASIFNYFNDLTVWSGASLLGQSNTGKTFTRNIADNNHVTADPDFNFRDTGPGASPACNSAPTGYSCSTQGSTIGHDAVTGDTNLGSLTPDGYFEHFMGRTPTDYRDNVATWVVNTTGDTSIVSNSTDVNSIVGMTNNTIWVEGDMTLPGDIGANDDSGTPNDLSDDIPKPVVLVVNGDLEMTGNSVIYGLVVVRGNINVTGTPTIYGAVVGAGTATATGNLKLIYDPRILAPATGLGKAAKMPGSWRDW